MSAILSRARRSQVLPEADVDGARDMRGAILVVPLILMPPFAVLCLNLFFDSFERKLLVSHSPEFLRPLVLRLFLRRPDLNSA